MIVWRVNFLILTIVTLITWVLFWVYISYLFKDPHLMNRGGALLAAFGALFVFFQLSREIKIDEEEKNLRKLLEATDPYSAKEKITVEKGQIRLLYLNNEKLTWIKVVTIVIFFGEILHGWGDFIYVGSLTHH